MLEPTRRRNSKQSVCARGKEVMITMTTNELMFLYPRIFASSTTLQTKFIFFGKKLDMIVPVQLLLTSVTASSISNLFLLKSADLMLQELARSKE